MAERSGNSRGSATPAAERAARQQLCGKVFSRTRRRDDRAQGTVIMHEKLLSTIVESVRRRISQGDCPTEAPVAQEQLEHAVDALASSNARLETEVARLRKRIWPNGEGG